MMLDRALVLLYMFTSLFFGVFGVVQACYEQTFLSLVCAAFCYIFYCMTKMLSVRLKFHIEKLRRE